MYSVNEQIVPRSLIREVNRIRMEREIIRWELVHEKWLVFLENSLLVARPYHNEAEEFWVVEEYALATVETSQERFAERVIAMV